MERELHAQYAEFQKISGPNLSRLHLLGVPVSSTPEDIQVSSFDDFKRLLHSATLLSKEVLVEQIRKCFKTHLKKADLVYLLRLGDGGFTEAEMHEAYRILPVDDDRGILVSDLLDFLYK